jgi:sterol desaturase/sphingolipid hydroxylase (fatty acid hydroxylase superfamily)
MDEFADIGAPGTDASPRLFENAILDRLSRVHHLVPLVLYAPLVLVLFYLSLSRFEAATIILGLAAGYVIWTLTEYFGHRFLFHKEFPGQLGARIHHLIHGVHHDHPSDPLRLVMPPLLSAPIMLASFGVLRLVFGPALVLPVLAGFIAGYIAYDMVHFHVHHARPQTWLGRMLRRRHMLHHFRDNSQWFGVSAPWWDEAFGTKPAARGTGAGGC